MEKKDNSSSKETVNDFLSKAINAGWKIKIDTSKDYSKDGYRVISKVWAPGHRDIDDDVHMLHLSANSYADLLNKLANTLKKILPYFSCPYCKMVNGHGEKIPISNSEEDIQYYIYIIQDQEFGSYFFSTTPSKFESQINKLDITEWTPNFPLKACPFCGRKLSEGL